MCLGSVPTFDFQAKEALLPIEYKHVGFEEVVQPQKRLDLNEGMEWVAHQTLPINHQDLMSRENAQPSELEQEYRLRPLTK